MKRPYLSLPLLLSLSLILSGCFEVAKKNDQAQTYTISGTVHDEQGNGIPDAMIVATKPSVVAKTDADGKWTITGLKGEVAIRAMKEGYDFTPPAVGVSGPRNDIVFVGTPAPVEPATISGSVLDHQGNPISGVTLEIYPFTDINVVIEADGSWTVHVPDLPVTIRPQAVGYFFNPESVTLDSDNDLENISFVGVKDPAAYLERASGEVVYFSRISDAVRAANPGEYVVVLPGTYQETLMIDKPLVLQGSSSVTTIIEAPQGSTSPVINVVHNAGEVTIQDLTIRNGMYEGILVETPNTGSATVVIAENTISGFAGDAVRVNSGQVTLKGNVISYSSRGVMVKSGKIKFMDNQIVNNSVAGVELSGVQEVVAENNQVQQNAGIGFHISSVVDGRVTVQYNSFAANQGSGMWVELRNTNLVIANNNFDSNNSFRGAGLTIQALNGSLGTSSNIQVTGNKFNYNTASIYGGGMYVGNGVRINRFENNEFTGNQVTGLSGGAGVYVGSNACLISTNGVITQVFQQEDTITDENGDTQTIIYFTDVGNNRYEENIPDVLFPTVLSGSC